MKRTSKYLNKSFDNGWVCTYVGISRVQARKTKHGMFSKNPGHQSYYYIFERPTSDGKADKLIRLSANLAAKVYRGELTVESMAEARCEANESKFIRKVSYHFHD